MAAADSGKEDAREFMRLLKQGVNLLGAHHKELFPMSKE